ncbi:SODIUM POTASSIUM ROOT DEFECTIVE 2-like protein [Drosera capensis]
MKRMNISIGCTSLASTAICNSMESLPFSSSSSLSSGGRAIDRHNPIITDTRRLVTAATPRDPDHHVPESKIKRSDDQVKVIKQQLIEFGKSKKKKNKKSKAAAAARRSSASMGSELALMKLGCGVVRAGEDYLDPPESSRFLLDDPGLVTVDRFEDLLDDEPVFAIDMRPRPVKHCDEGLKKGVSTEGDDGDVIEEVIEKKDPKPPTPVFSAGSHQVVVLRVSLHCKGCEGKVRKHISRMQGVASFNIDFAEKKVTVIGDVTPLGVLSSISKVKNAQLLTPSVPSSTLLDIEGSRNQIVEAVKK